VADGPYSMLGLLAVQIALGEAGTREQPPGSNRGPRVEVYQRGNDGADYLVGARWCGRFAKWAFEKSAQQLDVPSPLVGWGDLASAEKWKNRALAAKCLVSSAAIGRVALHLDGTGHGHVALVLATADDGIHTIGGNEGDSVRVVTRPPLYWGGGYVDLALLGAKS